MTFVLWNKLFSYHRSFTLSTSVEFLFISHRKIPFVTLQSAWHPKDLDSLWSGNVSIIFISGPVRLYGHGLGVATPFSVPAQNYFYLCGPPSSCDYCELQCYSI